MSVQSSTSRVQFTGNNSTVTAYAIAFPFALSGDLVVIVKTSAGVETQLTEVTDYVVTGAGDPNGGSIVTTAAWDNTYTVTIYREVDATQLTSYAENDNFPASVHETALDKLTHLVQQIARGVARCFKVTEASTQPAEAVSVVSSIAGLDGSGNLVFRTSSEMVSFLSLAAAITNFPLSTWLDDSERALAVPTFTGQVGLQRNTGALYRATGTSAGNWSAATLAALTLTNAMVSASAAIDFTKLAALTSGHLLVGSAGNVATNVALSGDATLLASGALTIANNAITTAKILDANVTAAKLAAGAATANLSSKSILQVQSAEVTALTTTTSTIPKDDTIPQISEGASLISASITPASASNTVRIRLSIPALASSASAPVTFAVFRGATANAIGACAAVPTTDPVTASLEFEDSPASTTAVTYSVRFGASSGTVSVNGNTGGRLFGGVLKTTLTLQEIKA